MVNEQLLNLIAIYTRYIITYHYQPTIPTLRLLQPRVFRICATSPSYETGPIAYARPCSLSEAQDKKVMPIDTYLRSKNPKIPVSCLQYRISRVNAENHLWLQP
jgi:hypothetical protein